MVINILCSSGFCGGGLWCRKNCFRICLVPSFARLRPFFCPFFGQNLDHGRQNVARQFCRVGASMGQILAQPEVVVPLCSSLKKNPLFAFKKSLRHKRGQIKTRLEPAPRNQWYAYHDLGLNII